MRIVKEDINGNEYYYLEQTYRSGSKVIKERKYLGKAIPEHIKAIKSDFIKELNEKRWYAKLDQIKENFSKEFNALPKTAKEKHNKNFLIRFTYDTNKIEGSTLTFKETARIIEEKLAPRGKPLYDVKETEAHAKIFTSMLEEKQELSLKLVLSWHKELFKDSDPEIAGIIRNHPVGIAGSKYEPPQAMELDYLLRKFFQWYNNDKKKVHPVELAALVHLKFVSIHPFTDGNGRMSRLMMNYILHKNGFPMLDIEYINRNSYYTALERSHVTGNENVFVQYLIKRYLKAYKKY